MARADVTIRKRLLETLTGPAFALALASVAALVVVTRLDTLLAALVVLGAIGAFVSGLMGIGGAIIMIPLLLYVPPAIGAGRLGMHEVAAVTMVQVLAAAAAGSAGHLRGGHVDRRMVVILGSGMMLGSLAGAVASRWLPSAMLEGTFATMAAGAAVMMIALRNRGRAVEGAGGGDRLRVLGFPVALAVGLLAGAVGAGGAFVMIPLMLHFFHLPARPVVGSSLVIVLGGAALGTAGKIVTGQVPLLPALALIAGSLPAGHLGAAASRRIRARHLTLLLSILIAAVAVKMWWDILR